MHALGMDWKVASSSEPMRDANASGVGGRRNPVSPPMIVS